MEGRVMGIYIKGFKPKDGLYVIKDGVIRKYKAKGGTVRPYELVEVKEPHGRLIDADEIVKDLRHDVAVDQDMLDYEELTDVIRETTQADKDIKQNAAEIIESLPTVIEGSEQMGVYIKGMKMPETCGKCKLNFLTDDYVCCLITDRIPKIVGKYANSKTDLDYRLKSIESVKRPEWCPLVEVKEPHGNLKDEREMLKFLEEEGGDGIAYDAVVNSPTIIEMSE